MTIDFGQHPIPRVDQERIVIKARIKKWQFLRVQVIVKVRRAYNPCDYMTLNPVCQLHTRGTS